ncbi:putative transcription factor B3-Domain family [Helianthus debilis subsp. tardiflorus]
MPVLTDGQKRVVIGLNLPKTSLLVFHALEENCIELSFFDNGVWGDCYYTFHRYGRLGVTIIEDAFINQCYGNNPLDDTYQICYKGSFWSVETSNFHPSYVLKGWPKVCNDIGIQDDDLLIFRRIDDVVFDLTIYRNGTEIVLTKRAESDTDAFKISKADYFENVFKVRMYPILPDILIHFRILLIFPLMFTRTYMRMIIFLFLKKKHPSLR